MDHTRARKDLEHLIESYLDNTIVDENGEVSFVSEEAEKALSDQFEKFFLESATGVFSQVAAGGTVEDLFGDEFEEELAYEDEKDEDHDEDQEEVDVEDFDFDDEIGAVSDAKDEEEDEIDFDFSDMLDEYEDEDEEPTYECKGEKDHEDLEDYDLDQKD